MTVPDFQQFATQYDGDAVFWMLYRSHQDEQPTVVCMQWFDVPDYDEDRFISPKRFAVEAEAEQALRMLPSVENIAKSLRDLYHAQDDNAPGLSTQYRCGLALQALGYDPVDYLFQEE